ncbi:MAG: tetratricopeptide repeat protein, partial [Muribaculum sp.]|nr:tetratricopeptide repeat protein [Muribaculum sp.]
QEVEIKVSGDGGESFFSAALTLSPEEVFERRIEVGEVPFNNINVAIIKNGKTALTWHAEPDVVRPIPDAAEAAAMPGEIKTVEQLFLTGQHLEQYRHATYSPLDYYEEALRRDPDDVRCNNAMGLWYIRKGRFDIAEKYLQKAVKVITRRNPNPYDGEPIYNLGLALKYQGRIDEAYDRFYKSTWNGAWQDAGYFACAQISTMRDNLDDALHEADRSLIRNWHNHKARALKATILRKLGRIDEAKALIAESLEIDPFNYGAMFESYLNGDSDALALMKSLMRRDANNYDEIALDYVAAGCYEEALALWKIAAEEEAVTPMTWYYSGWASLLAGKNSDASVAFAKGRAADPRYCFPNRLEAILALNAAMAVDPTDPRAPYFLGNLYYDKRQYTPATQLWERSATLDPEFPTVWRNLSLAYFNKQNDTQKAIEAIERAFSLDISDARILMELDQLYKRVGRPHTDRLALLRKYPGLVAQRDDLVLEEITLLNQTGHYEDAMKKLDAHIFHPWEGGEGKVPAQYQIARVELAKRALVDKRYEDAVRLLNECLVYPHHLGEGKLHGAQENDFLYFLGLAYQGMGDIEKARQCWEKATEGPSEPAAALYYNDAKPDKIFYQGLALRALGRENEARGRFNRLLNFGQQNIFEPCVMDYFAVSLPDLQIWDGDLQQRNTIHCNYMMALGHIGLGNMEKGISLLDEVSALDPNHDGIAATRTFIASGL